MTKAITLHAPWGSLIAVGAKRIETRSWRPPAAMIGQRLLIHQGARRPTLGLQCADEVSIDKARSLWRLADVGGSSRGWTGPIRLPLGAIVASCVLADAVPMVRFTSTGPRDIPRHSWEPWNDGLLPPMPYLALNNDVSTLTLQRGHRLGTLDLTDQRPYGDYSEGRWAWLLEDVKPTTERCPACWGGTETVTRHQPGRLAESIDPRGCWTCDGSSVCPPIPAKGKQGLWNWEAA